MTLKDKLGVAQSIVTIGAVVVGGLWTYQLFIMERKHLPHANIEQKISHVALSERANLLRVGMELTNTGNSRLLSTKSIVRIQQILPMPPCPKTGPCAKDEVEGALKEISRKADRFSWPLVAEREDDATSVDIEPAEKDFLEFEFAVPSNIKVVRVYSYFRNDVRSTPQEEVGWSVSTDYEFGNPKRSSPP